MFRPAGFFDLTNARKFSEFVSNYVPAGGRATMATEAPKIVNE
jgi:hypothetical protein